MAEQEEPQLWQIATPVEFIPHIDERTEHSIADRNPAGCGIRGGGGPVGARLGFAGHASVDGLLTECVRDALSDRRCLGTTAPTRSGNGRCHAVCPQAVVPAEPRRPASAQTGQCGLKFVKEKYTLTIQSQGVASGERVLAKFEPAKVPFERMSDLGMRDKMIATLKEKLDSEGTIILVTAPKTEGLTSTWGTAISAADLYIRDFQSFENQKQPET